jgi:CRP/FNR family transcriptional regulator, cyclic AMP receptor protein
VYTTHHMAETEIQKKVVSFFSQFQCKKYKKGEIILYPDTTVAGAYFIKKGHIREYGISLEGIEMTIHIFAPYSYFPMTWILSNIANRYYYEALSEVEIYCAPKEKVQAFLKQEPDVFLDLTSRLLVGLDKLTSRMEHLAFGKAYIRVISMLLFLVRHFGEMKNNEVILRSKFTHRDIGSLAGVSRETASREWERLEKKGLVGFRNQFIYIKNLDSLRKELMTNQKNEKE